MNIPTAIVLGIVQGVAEFLPISSSGHLVILQSLLPGFSQPGILFDVVLHFGTLFAVLIYFRKRLFSFINVKFITLLIIGTLPAVLVGLFFKDQVELLFKSVKAVGFALLATGFFNLIVDRFKGSKESITNRNALVTGVLQAVAIIPGLSRSGSTIFGSALQGIKKEKAAEFSFILSVPAVLGANLLEIVTIDNFDGLNAPIYLVGFVTSVIFGYLAINLVFAVISNRKFEYFAYYCFILGMFVILFF